MMFLVTSPELQHILADSGAVAVINTPELLAVAAAAAGGAPELRHLIVVGSGAGAQLPGHVRSTDFAELESTAAGGTTGRSTGVMLSHRNLYRRSAQLI